MQSRIKNHDKKISLSNQNSNLKPKLGQSKHPLNRTPKFANLSKKKHLLFFVALWPSTTNHPHNKPTIADRNLITPNPHHDTATNTIGKKTQTL